ncbi:ABC-2 type transport system ATP-binding protein [Streptomyces griseochromogenes]|nr:ATP-binding cassette domain-containing protein [Streptomyces griseochromogenes]MBP2051141.1 ABC-2 type transport system ATP-binding protein [Streptomyces griseochromogenes]
MVDLAIETAGLSKVYVGGSQSVPAVTGLDLEIRTGELFGLLGPNGAGKSTTIGMLTTLVTPTGGRATVAGADVIKRPVDVKRRISVVTQDTGLDRGLTLSQNLEMRGRLFGMSGRESRRRALELLEVFGLAERAKAKVGWVSGGQAQRLKIARSLMHRPDVLFLDEPTTGIDTQARLNLWEALRELHASGQTIVLTSHYLEEVESLCQRVAVIDDGSLLACDTVAGLKRTAGADTVFTMDFDGPAEPVAETAGKLPGVRRTETDGNRLRVYSTEPEGLFGKLADAGADHGLSVGNAFSTPPSLETAFLALTGRDFQA